MKLFDNISRPECCFYIGVEKMGYIFFSSKLLLECDNHSAMKIKTLDDFIKESKKGLVCNQVHSLFYSFWK